MSHPTDLLPYGEAFAELDLIVRELDDGTLTITDDDGLPDAERVQILARPEGLVAAFRVVPMPEEAAGLAPVLAELSRADTVFVWRGGAVLCEVTLPWTADHLFTPDALRGLYAGVTTAAHDRKRALEQVASGELEAPDLVATVAVPPSYLAGAGQSDRSESLTSRYGSVGSVPGQTEVESAQRIESARLPKPKRPGSGGAGAAAAVMVAVMLAAAGVGVFLLQRKGAEPVPALPDLATPAADPEPSAPEEQPRAPSEPSAPEPAQPAPAPAVVTLNDEASILTAAGGPDAELRLRAVRRWLELGLNAAEGGHLRLLRALGGRIDRDVGIDLLQSFRDHPVGTIEALDCLGVANLAIRRHLIEQLGHTTGDEVEVVAEMLREQEETPDLAVEVALLRLGAPRPGALGRLVAKNGVAWARGEGRALLAAVTIAELEKLASSDQEEVRVLACELLQGAAGDEALGHLFKLLRDDAERVRQRAIEALTDRGDPKSAWALARRLHEERDALSRRLLQGALEALPTDEAVKYLDQLLRSKRTADRLAAVGALHAIAEPPSIAAVVRSLRDAERSVRLAGLESLQALQRQPRLRDEVRKGILEIRRIAADTSDPEARRLARQLHFAVEGTMPPR